MLHPGRIDEKSHRHGDCHPEQPRFVVEGHENRGGCQAQDRKQRSDQHIDPEQGGNLIARNVDFLHRSRRKPERGEHSIDAGDDGHHCDEAEILRIQQARQNDHEAEAKGEADGLAAELCEASPQCPLSQITDFARQSERSRSQSGGGSWDGVAHLCPVSPGSDRSSTLGQFARPRQYAERLS